MRPVLFILPLPLVGPIAIKSYGVMLVLGFMCALFLAVRRARKEGINPDIVWDIWMYALLGGIIGSRAMYLFENYQSFSGRWLDIFKIWEGGLSFYGGFTLATISISIMLRIRRIRVLKMFDIIAVGLILGMAFGKVGCFMNGCCFGRPTDGPIAVTYPAGSPIDGYGHMRPSYAYQWHLDAGLISSEASRSLPVHPVQLYESVNALVIFAILMLFYPHRRRYGEVTCLLGTLYPATRFILEFFRQKQAEYVFGLTPAQTYSLIAFVVFATLFVISRRSQPTVVPRDEG